MTKMEIEFDEKYSEIFKLHDMLTKADIDHDFLKRKIDSTGKIHGWVYKNYTGPAMYQILYPNKESWDLMLPGEGARYLTCSIIEGPDTRGGDKNLLEVFGLIHGDDPDFDDLCGYLTAENVFNEIVKADEERKAMFAHMPKDATVEDK